MSLTQTPRVFVVNSTGSAANVKLTAENDAGQNVALATTAEGHLEVAVHAPRLPFGSLHAEKLTPIFQCDAVYGGNPLEVLETTGRAIVVVSFI